MCPALVFRPGLPAVSARNWPSASPVALFGASLSLERALRASRTRQHEDLLALFTPVQGSFLAVELLWHTLSAHADSQSHEFALGTVNTTMALHGGQCRAMLLKPISHAQRFTSAAATCDDSFISNGGYQRLRGIQVLVQLDQAESLHWRFVHECQLHVTNQNVCRTTCAQLPKILPRLRCPRHFCFPSELVRSAHHFGLGCCGLHIEPREFALDQLRKADDFDMLLELWDETGLRLFHISETCPLRNCFRARWLSFNAKLAPPRMSVTFNTACVWFSLWISLASTIVWNSTSLSAWLTSHVVSVALRFARDASCSPGNSWFLANSAVLRSLESFVSFASGLFSLCCWVLAAISSFFVTQFINRLLVLQFCTFCNHMSLLISSRSCFNTPSALTDILRDRLVRHFHRAVELFFFALEKSMKVCLVFLGAIRTSLWVVVNVLCCALLAREANCFSLVAVASEGLDLIAVILQHVNLVCELCHACTFCGDVCFQRWDLGVVCCDLLIWDHVIVLHLVVKIFVFLQLVAQNIWTRSPAPS